MQESLSVVCRTDGIIYRPTIGAVSFSMAWLSDGTMKMCGDFLFHLQSLHMSSKIDFLPKLANYWAAEKLYVIHNVETVAGRGCEPTSTVHRLTDLMSEVCMRTIWAFKATHAHMKEAFSVKLNFYSQDYW